MTRSVEPVLRTLRDQVLRMGDLCEAILQKAARAVFGRDAALGGEVQKDDLEIDRLDVAIDETVLRALALQAPVADDLREVVAVKMIATDLERVGDLARNIAKSGQRLAAREPVEFPPALQTLGEEAHGMLREALDAYANHDAERAQALLERDERVDADEGRVIRDALQAIAEHPTLSAQEVDLILVAKNFERVADHATNIAESAILVVEARNVKHGEKLRARHQA